MDVVNKDFIFTKKEFTSKDGLFKFVADELCKFNRANDPMSVYKGLIAREGEFSTYIDHHIAIPHCKLKNIKETTVVVVKNNSLIQWDEENQAKIFILLAVSDEHADNVHLKLLAKIATSLMDQDFVDALLKSESKTQLYDMLSSIEV